MKPSGAAKLVAPDAHSIHANDYLFMLAGMVILMGFLFPKGRLEFPPRDTDPAG